MPPEKKYDVLEYVKVLPFERTIKKLDWRFDLLGLFGALLAWSGPLCSGSRQSTESQAPIPITKSPQIASLAYLPPNSTRSRPSEIYTSVCHLLKIPLMFRERWKFTRFPPFSSVLRRWNIYRSKLRFRNSLSDALSSRFDQNVTRD